MPLLGVLAGAVLLRALGAMGGPWRTWRAALVPALGVMYVLTGAAAFTPLGEDLARFVPASAPVAQLLVRVSGAIQVAGGLALLSPRWCTTAAWSLAGLLLVKLPLNWYGARQGFEVRGPLPTPPALRVPLVLLWLAVLVWIARAGHRPAGGASENAPSPR